MVSRCNFASPVKRFRDSKSIVVLNKIIGLLRCLTILATIANRYLFLSVMKSLHLFGSTRSTNIFRAPRVSLLILILLFPCSCSPFNHFWIVVLFHYCNNRASLHRFWVDNGDGRSAIIYDEVIRAKRKSSFCRAKAVSSFLSIGPIPGFKTHDLQALKSGKRSTYWARQPRLNSSFKHCI